jgi:iron complex outermembrane receptor protein
VAISAAWWSVHASEPDAEAVAPTGLEEIRVTAQRRSQDSQHVPIPIAVLPGILVRNAGVSKPQELTYLVPALQVASTNAPYSAYYLRGVGNFTGNSLQDSAVAFNYDGVFIGRSSSTQGFFYDLERIEVLKGPQGTLYGRNATGGAINVLPRTPVLGDTSAELFIALGNEGTLQAEGAANLPLGERQALRVAGNRVRHDGYLDDGTDAQDDWAVRLSLLAVPNDRLSVRIGGDYFAQGGTGPGATPIALGVERRHGVSSAQGAEFYEAQRHALAGRNFNPIPRTQDLDSEYWGVNATIAWETDAGTLTVIPALRESNLDVVGASTGVTLTIDEVDEQASLEARFVSDAARRLRYVLGAYYLDETSEVRPFVPNSQYNMSVQRQRTGVESAAGFASVSFGITDDVEVSIGARRTRDRKFLEGSLESFNRLCLPLPTASCPAAERFPVELTEAALTFPSPQSLIAIPYFNPADGTLTVGFRILADEQATFSRTTWRAGLGWDVGDRNLLYAGVETGYKSGGFFFSNDDQTFEPEEVTAFTLGSKNRFFSDRLQLNVEAFHWLYEDQQISTVTLDSRGVTNLRTRNIGEATIQGAEVEARWMFAEDALVDLDLQYLDARYDEFTFVAPLAAGRPLTGCAVAGSAAGFAVDCSGRQLPNAPRWRLNLAAEKHIRLAGGDSLRIAAATRYQSETLTGLDFTALEYQSAFWSIDAELAYVAAGGKFEVQFYGRNLTDETVVANTLQPPFGSFVVGTLRPPRLYGVRLGVRL